MTASQSRTIAVLPYQLRSIFGGVYDSALFRWPAKRVGDELDYSINFGPLIDDPTDSIQTVDSVATSDAALSTHGAVIAGNLLTIWLAGGQAGVIYTVDVKVITALSRKIEAQVQITVLTGTGTSSASGSSLLGSDGETILSRDGFFILAR
jgi:hypothetical protein